MKYRALGKSGLKVSELCLGAMTFGEADENSFMHGIGSNEKTSFGIMDRAHAAGLNFIDVADVYGQDGLSERVVGRWMKDRKNRDDIVLATKFRFRMAEGPNGTGASRYRIMRTVEDSLRRLQTDRIELYQIHMQDIETPEEETLRALDDLVRQGKVLYLGCSNYAAYRLVESLYTSEKLGLERFVTLQAQYSLLVRELEREHVPLCERHGLGILPWSPLAGGFLSGKYERNSSAVEGSRMASPRFSSSLARFGDERGFRTVDVLKSIATEMNTTPTAVALAWLLSRPTVSSVIFGARSIEQLNANLAASGLSLPQEACQRLDEASSFELGYPYDFMKRIQSRW